MADNDKRFYTVKEVSRIMGICIANAYERLQTGEIPVGIKAGRRWLIPKVRFDEWWGDHDKILQRTEGSASKPVLEENHMTELLPREVTSSAALLLLERELVAAKEAIRLANERHHAAVDSR